MHAFHCRHPNSRFSFLHNLYLSRVRVPHEGFFPGCSSPCCPPPLQLDNVAACTSRGRPCLCDLQNKEVDREKLSQTLCQRYILIETRRKEPFSSASSNSDTSIKQTTQQYHRLYFEGNLGEYCANSAQEEQNTPACEPGCGRREIAIWKVLSKCLSHPTPHQYNNFAYFLFRTQVVLKWKNLGKVLCRLLRMSDYWYGFASDGALLSSEERAARRISVLQQVGPFAWVFLFEQRGGVRVWV